MPPFATGIRGKGRQALYRALFSRGARRLALRRGYFIAAILHDTVEDTATTLDEIENLFGKNVRNAVDSVSRREFPKKESYEDFVLRSKADPIGRVVKIADLYDNMSPERRPEPPIELDKKLERYEKASPSSPAAEAYALRFYLASSRPQQRVILS